NPGYCIQRWHDSRTYHGSRWRPPPSPRDGRFSANLSLTKSERCHSSPQATALPVADASRANPEYKLKGREPFAWLAGGQSEALPTTEWSGRRANAPLPTLPIAAPPGLGRAAMRSIYQRCAKRIEEMTGAALTGSGVVIAVEERTLLKDLERGLSAVGLQLHGRERHRNLLVVEVHHVRVDQAFVGNHVVIEGVESGNHAAFPTSLHALAATDAHVHVPLKQFPASRRAAKPLLLGFIIGQRLPHPRDRRVVGALEMEGRMYHRANAGLGTALHAHDFFLQFVECGAPPFLRARHHRRSHRRIDKGVGLHDVHARSAERVGKVDFGVAAEQRRAGARGDVHVDHQPAGRRYFDKSAADPVLLASRQEHADIEWAADVHLDPCLRNRAVFGAE